MTAFPGYKVAAAQTRAVIAPAQETKARKNEKLWQKNHNRSTYSHIDYSFDNRTALAVSQISRVQARRHRNTLKGRGQDSINDYYKDVSGKIYGARKINGGRRAATE
jgi:hypothetical protein